MINKPTKGVLFVLTLMVIMQFTILAQSNVFHQLEIEKNPVMADDTEVQKAYVRFIKQDDEEIEKLSIRINYLDDSSNPERGYMSWNAGTGFTEENGNGSEYINLVDGECSRMVDGVEITFTFAWKLGLDYGDIQSNDIAYYYEEEDDNYTSGWVNHNTNFNVLVDEPAELISLVCGKYLVFLDETDVQTVTLQINDDTPSALTFAGIRINYQDDSGNPDRGYLSWDMTGGFIKESGYGSEYINLLAGQCSHQTDNTTVTLTFAFSFKPSYTALADNDVSCYFEEYAGARQSGWVNYDTNFDAVSFLAFTITQNTTITTLDPGYDNAHLTVDDNVILTIAGAHVFNTIVLEPGAVLNFSSPADITLNILDLSGEAEVTYGTGSSGSELHAGLIQVDTGSVVECNQNSLTLDCSRIILDNASAMLVGGTATSFSSGEITLLNDSALTGQVTDGSISIGNLIPESGSVVSFAGNQEIEIFSNLVIRQGAGVNLSGSAGLMVNGDIVVDGDSSSIQCTDQAAFVIN